VAPRGLSYDPDHYSWSNTPWRVEPDPSELVIGDQCFLGIPETEVQVISIERHDPPADYGFLPRPEWVLGVCPVDSVDDEEAGCALYLDGAEPIQITKVRSAAHSDQIQE
jgi:hypothetical protein